MSEWDNLIIWVFKVQLQNKEIWLTEKKNISYLWQQFYYDGIIKWVSLELYVEDYEGAEYDSAVCYKT